MKKILKSRLFFFLLGAIIFGGIGVFASDILASHITYDNTTSGLKDSNNQDVTTVQGAIDVLYDKANNTKKTCLLVSEQYGNKGAVGSKYLCYLGDGVARYFYILKTNTNDVEMIMERNITDTVGTNKVINWSSATHFFDEGQPGYQTKQTWLTKVIDVKLPDAQTIVNAGGITEWNISNTPQDSWRYFGVNSTSDTSKRVNYLWLWDYARDCSSSGCSNSLGDEYATGYWTTDLLTDNSSQAFRIYGIYGCLGFVNTNQNYGVRPVITISKSQLSN